MFKLFSSLILSLLIVIPTTAISSEPVEHGESPLVVDLKSTTKLSDLIATLSQERVVYVAETHLEYTDHLMQLEIIKGLYQQNPDLVIGVEWFQQPFQEHLDQFIAGKISETELLKRTKYFNRWRFDWRLYRPIVQFAAKNNIPLIALNASKELTDAIKKSGINGLNKEMKAQLPSSYDFSNKKYQALLKTIFNTHPGPKKEEDFQRFQEIQLTWDESMAEKISNHLKQHQQQRMVVLAGRGHIESRFGIPNRVEKATGIKGKVILVGQQEVSNRNAADYILFAKRKHLPAAGLIGAMLDTKGKMIKITAFSKKSKAPKAGVKKEDAIVQIDEHVIGNYVDLKLALMGKSPGDTIKLGIDRDGKKHSFTIKLVPRSMY